MDLDYAKSNIFPLFIPFQEFQKGGLKDQMHQQIELIEKRSKKPLSKFPKLQELT